MLALILSALAWAAEPPPPDDHFAPVRPWVGHCLSAPGSREGAREIQCYAWMHGQAFVQMNQVTVGAGTREEETTIYSWDGKHQRLRYHRYASDGAVSVGHVAQKDGAWWYHERRSDPNGHDIQLISRVEHEGDRGYTLRTTVESGVAQDTGVETLRQYRRTDLAGKALARIHHDGHEWQLIHASERSGNWDLWAEAADGQWYNLTASPTGEWPYGRHANRLFLVSNARADEEPRGWRLAVLDSGAAHPRRIHDRIVKDAQVSMHPDGRHLAAVERRGDVPGIVLLDADSGAIVQWLSPEGIAESDPDFAPDGRLLFRSRRSGSWELWLRPVDGGEPIQLTSDPSNDAVPDHDYGGEGPARFSPDGLWITWQRRFPDRENDVWIMAADGTDARNLTAGHAGGDHYPDWSPDGQWIAFGSDREMGDQIWRIRPSGEALERLSLLPGGAYQPMWIRVD